MGGVTAAAVYARISSDQDGRALGVQRQLADCRRAAEAVGGEYVGKGISAYSGKRGPAYERMLEDLTAGSGMQWLCITLAGQLADRSSWSSCSRSSRRRVCPRCVLPALRVALWTSPTVTG